MVKKPSLKGLIPVIILAIIILSPMSTALMGVPTAVKAEDNNVYPEQVLLQLIEESNITVSQQVIDLLHQAASLRGEDNETANALVIQAFQLLVTGSQQPGTHCRALIRMALAYNNTMGVLYKAIERLEEKLVNTTTIPVLEEAKKHLEYASGNISLALQTLNDTCTNDTAATARSYLSNAREEIWAARNIIDTITACRFKDVILNVLQHRLVSIDKQIQTLSIKKAELESKGLTIPAMQIEKMMETLSARNQVIMQAIKEINETQNCTSLWALVTSMKMIHHYLAIQSNIVHHYGDRIKAMGQVEARTMIVIQRLETANRVLDTIASNAVGLPDDVRAKLQDVQSKLQDILSLYREAMRESWSGSGNINNTVDRLLQLTNETKQEINQLINKLPRRGYGQTISLLKTVSKSLDEIEGIVTHASHSMEKVHHRISLAKEVSIKLQLKTISKDINRISTLIGRYCNNTAVNDKLEEAQDYIQAALNTTNMTEIKQNLEAALNALEEAKASLNPDCQGASLVLAILELEVSSTLTLM